MPDTSTPTPRAVRARLTRARGQIDAVIRLLDEGRPCEDVLAQLGAADRALRAAGVVLLGGALRECVTAHDELRAARLERLFTVMS